MFHSAKWRRPVKELEPSWSVSAPLLPSTPHGGVPGSCTFAACRDCRSNQTCLLPRRHWNALRTGTVGLG